MAQPYGYVQERSSTIVTRWVSSSTETAGVGETTIIMMPQYLRICRRFHPKEIRHFRFEANFIQALFEFEIAAPVSVVVTSLCLVLGLIPACVVKRLCHHFPVQALQNQSAQSRLVEAVAYKVLSLVA